MRVINSGEVCCAECGRKLYSYIEFEGYNGELDGDTKDYCDYVDDLCRDCYEAGLEEETEEKEEENETESV